MLGKIEVLRVLVLNPVPWDGMRIDEGERLDCESLFKSRFGSCFCDLVSIYC
jgi:hypothetical protein